MRKLDVVYPNVILTPLCDIIRKVLIGSNNVKYNKALILLLITVALTFVSWNSDATDVVTPSNAGANATPNNDTTIPWSKYAVPVPPGTPTYNGWPAPASYPVTPAENNDPEVKLGRENADANNKTVKLITDPAIVNRVRAIGFRLACVANKLSVPALYGDSTLKVFPYTYNVVDDSDVNAYSLPGGFIYVDSGLLKFVKSDDELAGVLAHETAHAAHHHMIHLLKEQNKMQPALAALLVGLITAKSSASDLSNWLMASQLYLTAKMNSYSVRAEEDADHTAVYYMRAAGFNPVGILTFMERLARQEITQPQVQWGIYRTHPPSTARAEALINELNQLHIPIDRRAVDPSLRADTVMTTVNKAPAAEVQMYGTTIATLANDGSETAQARADKICNTLNELFDQGLLMSDVHASSDHTGVIARNELLITFNAEDAKLQNSTIQKLTDNAVNALRTVIWQDKFHQMTFTTS